MAEIRADFGAGSSPRVRGTPPSPLSAPSLLRFIPAGAGNALASSPRSRPSPVHPRGCGERARSAPQAAQIVGSSPRVRGTHVVQPAINFPVRFIPAGAGNAGAVALCAGRSAVHPRGCGERVSQLIPGAPKLGSSPRVRGTLAGSAPKLAGPRFIPAGAGNASCQAPAARQAPVHPRGCGERVSGPIDPLVSYGSSPRVRGTRSSQRRRVGRCRFIPAGAGNAPLSKAPAGENDGSSPRVRGTRLGAAQGDRRRRFIPAGAGNAASSHSSLIALAVHPRGCGERYYGLWPMTRDAGSSPRVRGTHYSDGDLSAVPRFIPAGAGNARRSCWPRLSRPVHPRGCGERWCVGRVHAPPSGSSPRVRGTHFFHFTDF